MERRAPTGRLLEIFLGELDEHVRSLTRDLLALERTVDPFERSDLVNGLFRAAHSLKGAARSVEQDLIEGACHRLEEIFSGLRDGRLRPDGVLIGRLLAATDALGEAGQQLRGQGNLTGMQLAAISTELAMHVDGTSPAGTPPPLDGPDAGPAGPLPERPQPAPGPQPATSPQPGDPAPPETSVRLGSAKLDRLLSRSAELMAARHRMAIHDTAVQALVETAELARKDWARIRRRAFRPAAGRAEARNAPAPDAAHAAERHEGRLRALEAGLKRLLAALAADQRAIARAADFLHDEVHRVRLRPFRDACDRLDRLARDSTANHGKQVEIEIVGGDIEVDSAVIEGLRDPLLHLVRNALDHGIETTAERAAAGKPAVGRIVVEAALHGSQVEVVVRDDGRGLDLDAIRSKARALGVAGPNGNAEAARLVFEPGFSTARSVSPLSGRGVGLDIVKSRIESMRGAVGVTSEAGRGARFALVVPLTLSTISAILVRCGDQRFALDTSAVAHLLRVGPGDPRRAAGRPLLLLDGSPVPLQPLASLLDLAPAPSEEGSATMPALIVSNLGRRAVLVVDEILGEQELLVRSLGPRLQRVRNVSGAALLPDGEVILILNAAELMDRAIGDAMAAGANGLLEARGPDKPVPRLLLVDDSLTIRALWRSILEKAGYEVTVAADGLEAWRLLDEQGADLVVSDVEMPGLDGFALTERIRASSRWRELPVLLVTALGTDADRARGLQAGADAYIVKNGFDQSVLLAAVAQLL